MTTLIGTEINTGNLITQHILHMENDVPRESITAKWARIESKAVLAMEKTGFKVLSVNTEYINKRRYKRIRAKKMLKLAKAAGVTT